MKPQILSRSYIQLENEIQNLKSVGGEESSLWMFQRQTQCAFQRVGKIK